MVFRVDTTANESKGLVFKGKAANALEPSTYSELAGARLAVGRIEETTFGSRIKCRVKLQNPTQTINISCWRDEFNLLLLKELTASAESLLSLD